MSGAPNTPNPTGQAVNDLGPPGGAPAPAAPAPAPAPAPVAAPAPAAPAAEAPAIVPGAALLDAKPEAAAPVEFKLEEVTLPEGVTIPESMAPQLTAVAKEHGLTASQMSALLPLHSEIVREAQEAATRSYVETNERWVNEVKADPKIGGANLEPTLQSIGKVLDQYGSPELRQALAYTGAGNHPEVIRFMAKIASQLNEGTPTRTGSPTGAPGGNTPKAGPNAMYPNLPG